MNIDNHLEINSKHISWLSGTITYRKVSYCQKGNITKETKREINTQIQNVKHLHNGH